MDIDSAVSLVTTYAEAHPYTTFGASAVTLILFYLRPAFVFKSLLGIGLIAGAVLLFQSLSGTLDSGIKNRDTMLEVETGD